MRSLILSILLASNKTIWVRNKYAKEEKIYTEKAKVSGVNYSLCICLTGKVIKGRKSATNISNA